MGESTTEVIREPDPAEPDLQVPPHWHRLSRGLAATSAVSLFMAAGLLVVTVLLAVQVSSARQEVSQLRQQYTQMQAQSSKFRLDRAKLMRETTAVSSQLSAVSSQAVGSHRDLITCADWNSMWVDVQGTDAYGNSLSLSGSPSLPSHCINN